MYEIAGLLLISTKDLFNPLVNLAILEPIPAVGYKLYKSFVCHSHQHLNISGVDASIYIEFQQLPFYG